MTRLQTSGFRFPYDVREAPGKGRGVFAGSAIARGQIVWQFLPGLFRVHDEPGFRAVIEPMSHADAVYEFTHTFGLDDFPDCVIRVLDDGGLINHSAQANLATNFSVPMTAKPDTASVDYVDQVARALCEDRFALIATRDIAAGEEFTNNYFAELSEPAFYLQLYEEYGIVEEYLE